MRLDLRRLSGPRLDQLTAERYSRLRGLHHQIEREPPNPLDLLHGITPQLPRVLLDQLLALFRAEGDHRDRASGLDDDEPGPILTALAAFGGLRFQGSITEDAFLAAAWLELAYQAFPLDQDTRRLVELRAALQCTRDEQPTEGTSRHR